jgi:hypothetical protein
LVDDGLINVTKIYKMSLIVGEITSRQVDYIMAADDRVIRKLSAFEVDSEDDDGEDIIFLIIYF